MARAMSAPLPALAAQMSEISDSPRQSAVVRITHWIHALSFLGLLVSGFAILLAHPRFYWGEAGGLGTPSVLDLPLPFMKGGPSGWGRNLHFLSAWVCVVTGSFYVLSGLLTRHFRRDLLPAQADVSRRSLARMGIDYVDLWQIHAVGEKAEVEQIFGPGGAMEAFEAAKKAGKCRFIGFTGHHDPNVHLEMLKAYERFDSILMPLNIADPGYLSFENLTLPVAGQRGIGIQGMKNFANGKLLQSFSAKECLSYVLSLPVSCTAIGCTTIGQLEDDVRFAQQY